MSNRKTESSVITTDRGKFTLVTNYKFGSGIESPPRKEFAKSVMTFNHGMIYLVNLEKKNIIDSYINDTNMSTEKRVVNKENKKRSVSKSIYTFIKHLFLQATINKKAQRD
jgi:hypothetical protein